ncbi:MAG TPA: hypothetical protein PLO33_00580 [Kouleothrix sp.]|uniref:hypothetical protein n=1 Tax=Kouleothrix sp. TaxID=2779161 RepID=UPI002C50BC34|nr:hypothetical protein [Kouleothrix sp.]HRC74137.1 hypothetical protein [Kouleothrix sp.]
MQLVFRHSAEPSAFRWRLAQPLALALSAGLGYLGGASFSSRNLGFAWMMFLFGFIWVLIISVALGLWLAYRVRLARGDWRAALHIGFASAFPPATVYLAMVALLTARIPLTTITFASGQHALARPDFTQHFPILFACSLLVGLLSGPLFAAWSPWRRAG